MIGALALLGLAGAQEMPPGWDYSFAAERFLPPADHYGYAITEGGATLKHLQVGVGLWLDYNEDPINYYIEGRRVRAFEGRLGMTYAEEDGDGAIDTRSTAHMQVGMGIADRFSFTADLPIVLWQDGLEPAHVQAPDDYGPDLISNGPGDLRLTPKVILADRDKHPIGVALLARITAPTGVPFSFIGEGTPTYMPMLVVEASDRPIHGREYRFRAAGNIGYLVRTPAVYGDQLTVTNEIVWRGAMGVHPSEYLEFGVDIGGALGPTINASPVEVLPWLQVGALDLFTISAGGGFGINPGVGAPDWRVFASATLAPSFNPKDLDRDKDGIQNNKDSCPNVPEDLDGFEDEDGCPENDNDKDGYLDPDDQCPNKPEDFDGFEDHDGCPDTDNDGDGILDVEDACPNDPETFNGYNDVDGCPDVPPIGDRDGDGYKDDVDRCPAQPEDFDGFEDHDGCPDPDNDQDGLPDTVDRCPNDPEDPDGFEDDDGCPDFDNDKDRILDRFDKCPNDPETYNQFEDEDGCPDDNTPKRVVLEKHRIVIYDKIYFEYNKANIKPESFGLLDEIGTIILDHPDILRIKIEGHTDSDGDDAYNLKLSQRRAEAVRTYLINMGVEPSRLAAQGFGELRPIAENTTDEGKSQNRRVEFHILEREGETE